MGGHGALICAMKNPGMFKSVSAFAPIANPVKAPWGIKAFTGYLGDKMSDWQVIGPFRIVIEARSFTRV